MASVESLGSSHEKKNMLAIKVSSLGQARSYKENYIVDFIYLRYIFWLANTSSLSSWLYLKRTDQGFTDVFYSFIFSPFL